MPAPLSATARATRHVATCTKYLGCSIAIISPDVLRNSVRIDNKSPSLLLLLYTRVQKAYHTRSSQREWHNSPPRHLSHMRKRYHGSRRSGDEGLSIYHDRHTGSPERFPVERGSLVQDARWMPEVPRIFHKQDIKESRRGCCRGRMSTIHEQNAHS